MKYNMLAMVVVAVLAVAHCVSPAFCQEDMAAGAAPEVELSVYGEVQAVNTESSSLTVQYYDYDTDEEKTAEIVIAKDAKIEGATGIADIKKGDWVDAAYKVDGGKNMADSIIVEKEEMELMGEMQEPAGTEPAEADE